MFQKILVCLDGSPLAEQVLPIVEAQARCFGSRIVLLQVYDVASQIVAAVGFTPQSADIIEQQLALEAKKASDYLESLAEPLRKKGIEVACVALRGTPGETIVGYSKNEPIDLIAIATHGRSGLGRVVFGSVADFVLRNSGLPVLAIKPRQ